MLETVHELFYIETIIWLFPVTFMFHTPGVITAIFIVIPYSILSYYRLFELGFIDSHLLFKSIPLSIFMAPIFLIGNLLGRKLIR